MTFIAVTFLLAALLPFFLLGFYNVPLTDDFTCAYKIREEGFFNTQVSYFLQWTGRYFSTLLIGINPVSLQWPLASAVIPAVSIAALCGSLYYFVKGFAPITTANSFALAVLFFWVYVSNLHSISQAFYWLPSLYTYITGICLFLVYWGFFLRLYNGVYRIRRSTYLLSALLIFMLIGTSEVMLFYHNYILLGAVLYCYFRHRPMLAYTLFSFAVSLACGLFSLFSPGNFARKSLIAGAETNYLRQVTIMLDTVGTRLLPSYIFNLSGILLLLFVAFAFSGQTREVDAKRTFKLKPLFLFGFLFAGFFVTFLPQLIANTSEDRAFNVSYFTYLLALAIAIGYAGHYYNPRRYFLRLNVHKPAVGLVLFVLCGLATFLPHGNTARAYNDLLTGDAKCYHAEQEARLAFLQQQQGKSLVKVAPLQCKPWSLFFVDADPNPNSWKNDGYKRYYNIDTIRLSTSLP